MAIGASNPPDMVSGSVIGASYVIVTHSSIATAVALAVPISMLMQMVWNLLMMLFIPLLAEKANEYAMDRNYSGVEIMHYVAVFSQATILAFLTGLGFYLGSEVIKTFVNSIPDFINNGFNYAMGIIPAIGFALLVKMIMTKKTTVFLAFGFLLAAYLKISILGVTAFGCVGAIIILFNSNEGNNRVESGENDNEF